MTSTGRKHLAFIVRLLQETDVPRELGGMIASFAEDLKMEQFLQTKRWFTSGDFNLLIGHPEKVACQLFGESGWSLYGLDTSSIEDTSITAKSSKGDLDIRLVGDNVVFCDMSGDEFKLQDTGKPDEIIEALFVTLMSAEEAKNDNHPAEDDLASEQVAGLNMYLSDSEEDDAVRVAECSLFSYHVRVLPSGDLEKQDPRGIKRWRKRFFSFGHGGIEYFRNKEQEIPKGIIKYDDIKNVMKVKDSDFYFDIVTNGRTYHLRSKKKPVENWVVALHDALDFRSSTSSQ